VWACTDSGDSVATAQQKDANLTDPNFLIHHLDGSTSVCLPGSFPAAPSQQPLQVTRSLNISNCAANNKLLLSSNQITSVVNVSVEVASTYEDIQCVRVPVEDTPIVWLCDFSDPIADQSIQLRWSMAIPCCTALLLLAAWPPCALPISWNTAPCLFWMPTHRPSHSGPSSSPTMAFGNISSTMSFSSLAWKLCTWSAPHWEWCRDHKGP
jgi:hypothetical protein